MVVSCYEDGHLRGSMKALRWALIFSRCFTVSKNTLPKRERRLQMIFHIKTTSNRSNWVKKMPHKVYLPHRCCCLLISSSATPLASSASCQSRRHSVDGWLVGDQNGKPFPLQLISFISWRVKLYLWRFNVHRLLLFSHRLAPPSLPRLRHTFFRPFFKPKKTFNSSKKS